MTSSLAFLQAQVDGPISREQWEAAEWADRAKRRHKTPRVQRLIKITNRANREALGSTDGRKLANDTLAHWLYSRATHGYRLDQMQDDLAVVISQAATHSRRLQWCGRIAGGDRLPIAAE